MPIKLIIFDLDGVLVDSRELHYESLNKALYEINPSFVITREEHLSKYDGHPTNYKLKLLTKEKGLNANLYNKIWKRKQELTQAIIIATYDYDERFINMMKELKKLGYLLFCASNSIWLTVKNMLYKKGFLEYIDYFISNEDVTNFKPSPEIYFKCFQRYNILPGETLICEDSPIGRRAAINSGANLCPIENCADLTLNKILKYIDRFNMQQDNRNIFDELNTTGKIINIVIPCAGLGSRFVKAGYKAPKPLIDVNGKPMIQVVVENINIKGRFIFIVQKSHCEELNMRYILNAIAPGCVIIETDGVTEGAACSILLAKDYINNDDYLITANSDQFLEWDARHFLYTCLSDNIDGCISTFINSDPKFSYAKTNDSGYVSEVAEKKVISNNATTGIYYWARGSDFVKYSEQMITKNIRVNNEFYTCPVYNEAIEDGQKVKIVEAKKFWCLGTPEDLEEYLAKNTISA
jgi:HAD superfamily hydrolase (TIGR01509 family)